MALSRETGVPCQRGVRVAFGLDFDFFFRRSGLVVDVTVVGEVVAAVVVAFVVLRSL